MPISNMQKINYVGSVVPPISRLPQHHTNWPTANKEIGFPHLLPYKQW